MRTVWILVALILFALLAAILSLSLATPHHAGAETERPEVVSPIGDDARPVQVQIEGRNRLWGTRRVGAFVDQRVAGLRIFRTGTCADRPEAVCVKVIIRKYGETRWWGEMWDYGPWSREVHLNATYGAMQNTACHEFLHALGLDHHKKYGCLSSTPKYPSVSEIAGLRRFYG